MIKRIQVDTRGAVTSMEEGTQKVDEGISLADKTGASLKEIVGVSQTVTDTVAQIAAASEQQSKASEQISLNVEGISSTKSLLTCSIRSLMHPAPGRGRPWLKRSSMTWSHIPKCTLRRKRIS